MKMRILCRPLVVLALCNLNQSYAWSQALRHPIVLPSRPYLWRNVEIGGGGFVSGLVFHPKERGLLYARTDIGGAYRWDAPTNRWTPLTDAFGGSDWNLLGIESLALDPNDPNRVYLAAGTYTNDWAGNGAILRSTDRGHTWARTDLPFKNGGNEDGRSMGERLVVSPRNSQTLFFGTRRNGLWTSRNRGVSWNKVASFPAPDNENGIGISFLTFNSNGTLYAGVASRSATLLSSSDSGTTWQEVPGAPRRLFPHHGVFASDGTLYLTYSNGPGPNGVSDGAVWKRTGAGVWTNITPDTRTEYAALGVDARNPRVLMVSTLDRWAQGDDILRSTDGGASWTGVKAHSQRDSSLTPYLNWGREQPELGHWIGDVEIDPFDSNHVLYVTGATIWGSDDARALDDGGITHWSVRAAGIEEVSVSHLISPPVGPHLISGMRDIGGFVHDDLTRSPRAGMMSNPRLNRNEGLDFAGQKPTLVVRVGDGNGGFSLDSGATWRPFAAQPVEKMNVDAGRVAVGADGADWVWSAGGAATYFSCDGGATWTKSSGLPEKAPVVSDRVTPRVFYAPDEKTKRLLISPDGGATFVPRGQVIAEGYSQVFASSHGAGDLWMTGSSGLIHSLDGGQTWVKIPAVDAAGALGFGKAAPGAAYDALYLVGQVGGIHGVFRSDDTGQSWARINDDRHQWGGAGGPITGDPRVYGRVFLGSNGRGILWGEPVPTPTRP